MKAFSILFKPVGDRCNLSCRYCFYLGHGGGVASRDVVDALLASYMALPFAEKSVALQGGEPLLSPEYVFDMMEAQQGAIGAPVVAVAAGDVDTRNLERYRAAFEERCAS